MGGGGVQICEGGLNPLADFVPRGSKSASGFVPRGPNLLADLYQGVQI